MIRSLKDQVAPILLIIFQQSLNTGQIPSDWKKAIVTPLFKKDDKCDPANYRLILLTCICCKLIEHILHQTLQSISTAITYYTTYNMVLGSETQLIQLTDELARGLSSGRQTDPILLDFSKAFDKVSHTKLFFKLHQHGITRNNLSWIKAFLLGHSQCVALEGEKSSEVPVTSVEPQGSVLGQILFLLYINDLPENINSQVRLVADDTAVYLTVTSKNDSQTCSRTFKNLKSGRRHEKCILTRVNAKFCILLGLRIPFKPSMFYMAKFWR